MPNEISRVFGWNSVGSFAFATFSFSFHFSRFLLCLRHEAWAHTRQQFSQSFQCDKSRSFNAKVHGKLFTAFCCFLLSLGSDFSLIDFDLKVNCFFYTHINLCLLRSVAASRFSLIKVQCVTNTWVKRIQQCYISLNFQAIF